MKKWDFLDFANYLESIKNGYFNFMRVKFQNQHNGRIYRGYRYVLEKPLTDEQRAEILSKYNNVSFGTAQYKHAPEIRHNTIILFDNKLSTVLKGV